LQLLKAYRQTLAFFAEYRALNPVLPDGYGLRFRNPKPKSKGKNMVNLIQLPSNRVICHYAQTAQGWAVVTPSGKVLAPSFYALKERFMFHSSINGAGGWVVLVPRSSSFSQEPAIQQSLF